MSLALYGVFLGIQTLRHRDYFIAPDPGLVAPGSHKFETHQGPELRPSGYHALLLITYLLPVVMLSKQIAVPIEYDINVLHAPKGLGGLLVAVLVMSPKSLAAARAARANQLQRSGNILLGSVWLLLASPFPRC